MKQQNIPESHIKIRLIQTEKKFVVRYKHEKRYYVFNIKLSDDMRGTDIIRDIEIRRMKLHREDCKHPLTRKTMEQIKNNIKYRFNEKR